jgi:hypothetical protein
LEHWLPIKSGFRPYKQPTQRFNPIIHDRVKEEVERLLRRRIHLTLPIHGVGFQHCISGEEVHRQNLGMYRFSQFNKGTPKNEYPMPIAVMLINNTSGH